MAGDISIEIAERVVDIVHDAFDVSLTAEDAVVRPSTRPGVDFQCNVAMSLGKTLGVAPRDVATRIASALDDADLIDGVEVAGPGFINIQLANDWLEARATKLLTDAALGVAAPAHPHRVALDYSSPNVAKEMHLGHLRSSIIGDSIRRTLTFAGHEVLPHNHIGDWGTPFGMLIEHLVDLGLASESGTGEANIHDLDGFYVEARAKFNADDDFATRARKRVATLQSGDAESLALWRTLVAESERHFRRVYDLLGIELGPDDTYGESFYNPWLDEIVDDLTAKGMTTVSDGAVVTFPKGFTGREDEPLPLIVRKSDGGYGYAATDLATTRYWTHERGADTMLYVVGKEQAQHFAMIFETSREAGYLHEDSVARHLGTGHIQGADGKKLASRTGGAVKLVDLLVEVIEHAESMLADRDELNADERQTLARQIGVGAVKYQDLSSDREKDYRFTMERMLSTEGNTSVYLQYANARIRSLLRRASERGSAPSAAVTFTHPSERALVLAVSAFAPAVASAAAEYAPHKLCTYLFELASAFSHFYENAPILASTTTDAERASRLALAELTSRTLTVGLSLLGIDAPERM